jgi:hypothetical protein
VTSVTELTNDEVYTAHSPHTEVVGVGTLNKLHNFAWLNRAKADLKKDKDALCIVPSNHSIDIQTVYGNCFTSIKPIHVFTEKKSGKPSRFFTLYLIKNYKVTNAVHTTSITALLPKSNFNTLQHRIEFMNVIAQKKASKPVLQLNSIRSFNHDDRFLSNYISYIFHPPNNIKKSESCLNNFFISNFIQ